MSPRRPVPERLRIASGLEERTKNTSVGIGEPPPPRHLPPTARAEWRRVVKACSSYPLWLQEADRPILEAWCTWVAIYADAVKALADDGVLVAGRAPADKARGAQVKHPAITVLRAATSELRYLAKELGFSPDARAKVPVGALEPDDDDDDFMATRLLS